MTSSEKSLIDQAAELAENLKPTIESAVTATKEATAPLLAEGKALAAEKAAATKAAAAAAAAKVAETAKQVDVPGVESETKSPLRWLKRLVVLAGVAAIAAVVYKKLRSDDTEDNWQSAYVPTPPPPAPAPVADVPEAEPEAADAAEAAEAQDTDAEVEAEAAEADAAAAEDATKATQDKAVQAEPDEKG